MQGALGASQEEGTKQAGSVPFWPEMFMAFESKAYRQLLVHH